MPIYGATMGRRRALAWALGTGLVLALGTSAAHADKLNTSFWGTAVGGYDVVAYLSENRAVEGSSRHSVAHNGATYYFASAEHRDRFLADPERYLPAYGGYCAFGVAQGQLLDVDPEAFTVHDGTLYLNYNQDIRERWRQDIDGFIAQADAKWPELQ